MLRYNSPDSERLAAWYARLYTEWLPKWVDLPENAFHWWNLCVIALEDASCVD
jgi:hypothetical protein